MFSFDIIVSAQISHVMSSGFALETNKPSDRINAATTISILCGHLFISENAWRIAVLTIKAFKYHEYG